MKLTFKQKRKLKQTARKVLYFLSHPFTNKELNTIRRDVLKWIRRHKQDETIYNNLTVPDSCFKTNKQTKIITIYKYN